jgi:hypothetical protein
MISTVVMVVWFVVDTAFSSINWISYVFDPSLEKGIPFSFGSCIMRTSTATGRACVIARTMVVVASEHAGFQT